MPLRPDSEHDAFFVADLMADRESSIPYPLLHFEHGLDRARKGELTAIEAESYRRWLVKNEAPRTHVALSTFEEAGFRPSPEAHVLDELTKFLVRWYPRVMMPYRDTDWRIVDVVGLPGVRGLNPGWNPSIEVSTFKLTIAHDLAFIVASTIRKTREDLTWSIKSFRHQGRSFRYPTFWNLDLQPITTGGSTVDAALLLASQSGGDDPLVQLSEQVYLRTWPLRSLVEYALEQAPRVDA